MTSSADPAGNWTTGAADQAQARMGLGIARFTIGAMFVWVFFENLGKGLYTTMGYAQALTEISFGIMLVLGLFTRPVAAVAFLYLAGMWISQRSAAWIWELLEPVLTSFGLAAGRAGRGWGIDALQPWKQPSSAWW